MDFVLKGSCTATSLPTADVGDLGKIPGDGRLPDLYCPRADFTAAARAQLEEAVQARGPHALARAEETLGILRAVAHRCVFVTAGHAGRHQCRCGHRWAQRE